jgi:hypothetical protein
VPNVEHYSIISFQLISESGNIWPWTDQAHLPEKHVDQLRQLVKLVTSEESTERRDSWVVSRCNRRRNIRVIAHGSQLDDTERTTEAANPLLQKEAGCPAIDAGRKVANENQPAEYDQAGS